MPSGSLPEAGTSTRLFPKGLLKIFLGASPGVGKTFAMLQAAVERQQKGVDVVVGLAETHKRKETEDQLQNLEVLPRKTIIYRGRSFDELDLDGVLARAPQLVLIDECAHSNLPGSRHPKRHNDISEILEHGIDVYTTLNIQHLESLKDIVEKMTHITIRESVPDSFMESADEVQLIDLPPDDLLQRLADGKVYVPEQAKTAIDHFFSRSNLLTLRELALRHTVTVADDKMAQYVQQRGIKGPWPASDKLMVCIDPGTPSAQLVREARRMADRLQAKWIAVTVEIPDDEDRSIATQHALSRTLRLAQELGADEVVALDGADVAETLIQHALAHNVTEMVVGQSYPKKWEKIPGIGFLLKGKTTAEKILLHPLSFTLRVTPITKSILPPLATDRPKSLFASILPYMFSLMITLGMLVATDQLGKRTTMTNIPIFFFLSMVGVSLKFGLAPTFLGTVVGSLICGYVYSEPYHPFDTHSLEGWVVFLSFLFTVLMISNLTIHFRRVFSSFQGRLRQIRFFSNFIRNLSRCTHKKAALDHLAWELHQFLNVAAVVFQETNKDLVPFLCYPGSAGNDLTEVDASAIQWALAHQTPSGRSTENFSDARYLYFPLKIGNNSLGVVGIWALKDQLTLSDFRIAQTLIEQAALAIDRLTYIN